MYVAVNAKEIYPLLAHRGDEEIRNDVLNVVDKISDDIVVSRVVTNIDRVYNGFKYNATNDLQPYHTFKIELILTHFKVNETNC